MVFVDLKRHDDGVLLACYVRNKFEHFCLVISINIHIIESELD